MSEKRDKCDEIEALLNNFGLYTPEWKSKADGLSGAIAAFGRECAAEAYDQVSITCGDGNAVRRWAEATAASLRAPEVPRG